MNAKLCTATQPTKRSFCTVGTADKVKLGTATQLTRLSLVLHMYSYDVLLRS